MSTPEQGIDTGAVDAVGGALAGDGEAVASCAAGAAEAVTGAADACGGGPLATALAELAVQLETRGRHLGSALGQVATDMRGAARDADALDGAGARAVTGPSLQERV